MSQSHSRFRKSLPVASLAVLVGLTVVASRSKEPVTAANQRIHVEGIEMTVPASLAKLGERHQGSHSSVVFGQRDDSERYFERFLGVFWSADGIAATEGLPSADYRVLSKSRAEPIDLGGGRRGSLTNLDLRLTRPCGRVDQLRLSVIEFTLASTGQRFKVAGLIEPFLSEDVLVATARSITASRR